MNIPFLDLKAAYLELQPEIDAAIKRHYRDVPSRGALGKLVKRLGVTRQWFAVRAATLGVLPVTRDQMHWLPEEDALLEEHSTKRADRIAKIMREHGYYRTQSAIGERLRRGGFDRFDPDVFNALELAKCMGTDSHVVLRWLDKGQLKGKRIETNGRTAAWEIKRKDLRAFLIASAEWDHRRCPREWLIDILTGNY